MALNVGYIMNIYMELRVPKAWRTSCRVQNATFYSRTDILEDGRTPLKTTDWGSSS